MSYQKYGDRKVAEAIFQNMIEFEKSGVKKEQTSQQSLDHTIRAQFKGDLISECFSLWLKCPKIGSKSFPGHLLFW